MTHTPPPTDEEAQEALHMRRCEHEDGPVCRVREDMRAMDKRIDNIETEQTKLLAVLGFWKWALPVVAATVGVFASLVGALLRARHGG